MENPNPEIEQLSEEEGLMSLDDIRRFDETYQPVTISEVYYLLKGIKDPEHPDLSLAQLRVVKRDLITITDNHVGVLFTPTIPTCSVAVLIGLTLLRKLQLCLPERFKIEVKISPGKHVQEKQVNRQLADKERVAAAMENPNLSRLVREGVYKTDTMPEPLLIW
jgi:metal-sulfur cluster biosynthetic enzyme